MKTTEKKSIQYPIISFIIFFIIIVVCIPLLLIKNNRYEILSMYLPNVDLIASLITWKGSFFKGEYFDELYLNDPSTKSGVISQMAINYIALMGFSFLIAYRTKLTNSISAGWSIAFVMAIVTYLVPTDIIEYVMDNISKYIGNSLDINNEKHNKYKNIIKYLPSIIIGLILTVGFILFEKFIIETFPNELKKIADSIISIGK